MVPQIQIHPQGPSFSRFSWGTWRLADGPDGAKLVALLLCVQLTSCTQASPQSVLERIKACLALGITTFDLADIYGGFAYEKVFGGGTGRGVGPLRRPVVAGLALEPELRSQMQIVSKCGIMFNCEQRPNVKCKHYDTSKCVCKPRNNPLSPLNATQGSHSRVRGQLSPERGNRLPGPASYPQARPTNGA